MTTLRGVFSGGNSQTKNSHSSFVSCNTSPDNLIEEANLSKSIFYACMSCGGPMIPIATCSVCKRTTFRQCTHCGKNSLVGSHQTCQNLVSFGANLVRKNSMVKS